jgi:hypothetical protein
LNRHYPATDFKAAYLDAVIDRYGNPDDLAKPQALRNLASRQPAYWTTARYGHVGASLLRDAANEHVGIEAGIRTIPAYAAATVEWIERHSVTALDTLVPLNDAAMADLDAAYEIAGTFRSRRELEARGSVSLLDAVNARKVA